MIKDKPRYVLALGALAVAGLACSIIDRATGDELSVEEIEARAVETVYAALTEEAASAPTETPVPQDVEEQASEPIIDESTTVSLSSATNCRTGPSANFDLVAIAEAGQDFNVVGQYDGPYLIVELPGGKECWLWLEYATVLGDTSSLPYPEPPPEPSPEPSSPFVLSHYGYNNCGEDIYMAVVALSNNSGYAFDSAYVNLIHLQSGGGTHGMFNEQNNGPFLSNPNQCPSGGWDYLVPGSSKLNSGGSAYISMVANQRSSAYGENVQATVKVCTQDNQNGDCYEQTIVFGLPSEWKN